MEAAAEEHRQRLAAECEQAADREASDARWAQLQTDDHVCPIPKGFAHRVCVRTGNTSDGKHCLKDVASRKFLLVYMSRNHDCMEAFTNGEHFLGIHMTV